VGAQKFLFRCDFKRFRPDPGTLWLYSYIGFECSLSGIPCTRVVRQSGHYLASFQSKLEADVPSLCGALGRQRRSDWSVSLHRDGVMCSRSVGGGLHGQLGSPGSSQQLPQPTEVLTKPVSSFEPLRKSARISSQLSLRGENLTEF
jgi:hypothetical protein